MVKVSVIIPCYNKERYIGKTLESLKAQHYANKEFIFIDDGSTDAIYLMNLRKHVLRQLLFIRSTEELRLRETPALILPWATI